MSIQICSDLFARADTAFNATANNTSIGGPDSFASPDSGQPSKDFYGNKFALLGGALICSTATGSNTPLAATLHRPATTIIDGGQPFTFSFDGTSAGSGTAGNTVIAYLRQQNLDTTGTNAKAGFYAQIGLTQLVIGHHTNTGITTLGTFSYTANATYAPSGSLLTTGRTYDVIPVCTGVDSGINIRVIVLDTLTQGVIVDANVSGDSILSTAAKAGGGVALGYNPSFAGRPRFRAMSVIHTPLTNLRARIPHLRDGSQGQTIPLNGVGTSWLTSQPTFALSGAAGVTMVSGSTVYTSDTEASIRVNVAVGASGQTLTITDPSQGSSNTVTLSVLPATNTSALISGLFMQVPDTATTIKIPLQAAYNGVGPYTWECYRGRTTNFAITDSGIVNVSSNIVNGALVDTPPDDNIYCYKFKVTSADGKTVTTFSVKGRRNFSYPSLTLSRANPNIHILFLGDQVLSNTVTGTSLMARVMANLTSSGLPTPTFTDCTLAGVGSQNYNPSYVPGTFANKYPSVITAYNTAVAAGKTVYAVVLVGGNDTAVTGATYQTNVEAMLTGAATDAPGLKFIACYQTPNQGALDSASGNNFIAHNDVWEDLVTAGTHSNLSSTITGRSYYVYSSSRPGEFNDNLQLSATGNANLSQSIAQDILTVLPDNVPPSYLSGTLGTNGTTLPAVFSKAIVGNTGFTVTVAGVSRSFTISGAGANRVFELNTPAYQGQTVKLNYTPGDVVDTAATPNAMLTFSNGAVTNNSTVPVPDTTPPTLQSAVLGTDGVTLTRTFSKNIQGTVGFSEKVAGVSRGISSTSYSTNTITSILASPAFLGETVLDSYSPGDVTDTVTPSANALLAYADVSVTNNSTVLPGATTFEDSFAGVANKLLEERLPTAIADDSPIAGTGWTPLQGGVAWLTGGAAGTGRVGLQLGTIKNPIYYVNSAFPINYNYSAEMRVMNLNSQGPALVLGCNPDTGDYYYAVFGFVGGTYTGVRIMVSKLGYLATVIADYGVSTTALPLTNNTEYWLRFTQSRSGSVTHLKFEYRVGSSGAYTTLHDADVSTGNTLGAAGRPGMAARIANTNSPAIAQYKATYYPGPNTDPTTRIARFGLIGDSENDYGTPTAQNVATAVARKLEAQLGYNKIIPHVWAHGGASTLDWMVPGQGNVNATRLMSAALTKIALYGIKVMVNAQGPNDAKSTVNTSASTFRDRIITENTLMKAAGAQRILLIEPAAVNEAQTVASGLFGTAYAAANTNLATYGPALDEVVAADPTSVTVKHGPYAFYLANQGTDYLYTDGLHHPRTTLGAAYDVDTMADGLAPLLLEQYPLDITKPTVNTASINSLGNLLTIDYSETVQGVSASDYTLSGGYSLSNVQGTGATRTFTISPVVPQPPVAPTLSYSGTSTTDTASPANALDPFTGKTVTNGSTVDQTAPTLPSIATDSTGGFLLLVFSESIKGFNAAQYTLPGHTLGAVTGSGASRAVALTPPVYSTDTGLTLDYSGNSTTDLADNPLATFTGRTVTNASTTLAPDVTPPAVPVLSAPVGGDGQIYLAWSSVSDAAGYELDLNGTVYDAGLTLGYTDTGLTNGVQRSYRVRAYDAAGNRSAWSAAQTVTPMGDNTIPEGYVRVKGRVALQDVPTAGAKVQITLRGNDPLFIIHTLQNQEQSITVIADDNGEWDKPLIPVPAPHFWEVKTVSKTMKLSKLVDAMIGTEQEVDDLIQEPCGC